MEVNIPGLARNLLHRLGINLTRLNQLANQLLKVVWVWLVLQMNFLLR
jgi:hypothetical protein